MIDLELLAPCENGIIVSVGAVPFDMYEDRVDKNKGQYWELQLTEQKKLGREVWVNTIQWWANQSIGTIDALRKPDKQRTPHDVFFEEFKELANSCKHLYAKGHDQQMLAGYYRTFNRKMPVRPSLWRDCRVFYDIAKREQFRLPSRPLDAHNALADAEYQAEIVCHVYYHLVKY